MKIIINESKIYKLLSLMNESNACEYGSKKEIIEKYLANHYLPFYSDTKNDKNEFVKTKFFRELDTSHQPTNDIITPEKLYYILQEKFKNIYTDKKERNEFLWKLIYDWHTENSIN